jgi:hypothetical protein
MTGRYKERRRKELELTGLTTEPLAITQENTNPLLLCVYR